MIEVKMPREISIYKAKLWLGFTTRQAVCLAIGCAINIPLYIFLQNHIGSDAASWIVIIVFLPILAVGFLDHNGMPYEKYMLTFIKNEFIYPQKRKYKTQNIYEILDKIESKKTITKVNHKSIFSKRGKLNDQ